MTLTADPPFDDPPDHSYPVWAARGVLAIMLGAAALALPMAPVTALVSAILGGIRFDACPADTFLKALPPYGSLGFNILLLSWLDLTFLAWAGGWAVLKLKKRRLRSVVAIRLGQVITLACLPTLLGASSHAGELCFLADQILTRDAFGTVTPHSWAELSGVRVRCGAGRASRRAIDIDLRDGTRLEMTLDDIANQTSGQRQLWLAFYGHKVPVSFGTFDLSARALGETGCADLFPGLRVPG